MQSPFLQKVIRWIVPLAALTVFAAWMYIAPPGFFGKADAIGYAVCHRIGERSFHIGEMQLPLCARCSGTFSAAAITMLFLAVVSGKRSGMPAKKFYIPFLLFFLAFGLDGANSYLYLLKQTTGALGQIPNLYIPNNTLRIFTGSGMGMTMAAFLVPAFNQTVWRDLDAEPALAHWKHFLTLFGILLVADLLSLTESPIALYPLAIISTLGVLGLLSLIFGIIWLMLMRQDNTFTHARELWLMSLAGLTLALLMVLSIDLLRYNLTGTWGGFPLG